MIIFLYGQDTYRLKEKSAEIVAGYQEARKSGLNLRYFDEKKLNYRDFEDEFRQRPMFQEKKLFVLKNIFSNPEFKNLFLKNSEKFLKSDHIILIQQEGEISLNDPLFVFLRKGARIQEFRSLEGAKLRNWIWQEFAKYSASAEPQAVGVLADSVGNNLWRLSNEIKKLAAFKKGRKVKTKDVRKLVKPKVETNIFRTIDAVAAKDRKSAFSLLYEHLEKGDSHLYLLAMINFQFRNLLQVKSGAKLRAHPYVVRKSLRQAGIFSLEELRKIYSKLFEIDCNVKTGRLDPQTALDLLIAEI